jgi:hypothetical protein
MLQNYLVPGIILMVEGLKMTSETHQLTFSWLGSFFGFFGLNVRFTMERGTRFFVALFFFGFFVRRLVHNSFEPVLHGFVR